MFLGLPDDIHEEKPSFLQFKKNALPTDGPTDRRTDRPSFRDARKHLKIQTELKTDKYIDRQTGRKTDRETDGQKGRMTETHPHPPLRGLGGIR